MKKLSMSCHCYVDYITDQDQAVIDLLNAACGVPSYSWDSYYDSSGNYDGTDEIKSSDNIEFNKCYRFLGGGGNSKAGKAKAGKAED